MTAVAVELLTRPPEPVSVVEAGALLTLAPDAVEFVADTDTLITMRVQREQRPAVLRLGNPRGLTDIPGA